MELYLRLMEKEFPAESEWCPKEHVEAVHTLLKEYIPQIFTSKEMTDFLCEHAMKLSKKQIRAMIGKSPISLWKKYFIFSELLMYEDLDYEKNITSIQDLYPDSFLAAAKATGIALEELRIKKDGLFLLSLTKSQNGRSSIEWTMPFTSYEKVKDYIQSTNFIHDPGSEWLQLEKWKSDDEGEMECICSYIMVYKEIVTFQLYKDDFDYCDDDFFLNGDLRLPVPFQVGDILEVNAEPFNPRKRVLYENTWSQRDCCGAQVIYMDEEKGISTGALKHSHIFTMPYPAFPALYSATKYDGELEAEEKIFYEFQNFIQKHWDIRNILFRIWLPEPNMFELPEKFWDEMEVLAEEMRLIGEKYPEDL